MNKKFMGLVFVVIICGCHAPAQSAVCPSPEEADALPDPEKVDVRANMSEEEKQQLEINLERGRDYIRRTRAENP